jgi:hypothetical protein
LTLLNKGKRKKNTSCHGRVDEKFLKEAIKLYCKIFNNVKVCRFFGYCSDYCNISIPCTMAVWWVLLSISEIATPTLFGADILTFDLTYQLYQLRCKVSSIWRKTVWCTSFFEYPFNSTFTERSVDENYKDVLELLSHIQNNEYRCYYRCLWNGSSIKSVNELSKALEIQQQQKDYIDKARKNFNFLFLANLLVVYSVWWTKIYSYNFCNSWDVTVYFPIRCNILMPFILKVLLFWHHWSHALNQSTL